MPKYTKKYNHNWDKDQNLKSWVQRVPGDDTKAACRFCKCVIRAHYNDLCNHAGTSKHKRNAIPGSGMRTLFEVGVINQTEDNSVKMAELRLCAHIACHSSIVTIDHLGELIKNISQQDISVHRTKCSAIIKNVLCPSMKEALINDLKEEKYSLVIDESTDVGSEKQLCVMVRYYSKSGEKIVTTFLGLISLEAGNADCIFNTQGIPDDEST